MKTVNFDDLKKGQKYRLSANGDLYEKTSDGESRHCKTNDLYVGRHGQVIPEDKELSERKFYQTIMEVEILSDEPIDENAIKVEAGLVNGSIRTNVFTRNKEHNAASIVERLAGHGEKPAIFNLDDEGHDIDGKCPCCGESLQDDVCQNPDCES